MKTTAAGTAAPLCLWFDSALLSGGWTENVRLSRGQRYHHTNRARNVPALRPGDQRAHGRHPRPLPTSTATRFSAGWRVWRRCAAQPHDNFWTWREIMYRFLDRITPEDMEAIATLAYVEMLESRVHAGG